MPGTVLNATVRMAHTPEVLKAFEGCIREYEYLNTTANNEFLMKVSRAKPLNRAPTLFMSVVVTFE